MSEQVFSILICTKNRKDDLIFTLNKIRPLLDNDTIQCVVCDDGSADGTFEYLQHHFPKIMLLRNQVSKGLIFCRNLMLNQCKSKYAISLDDDANFISENPLDIIEEYFQKHPNCGLIAFRIFWGLNEPIITASLESTAIVKGFVGCAHVWRMAAWHDIPNYPAWFIFYGEEDFASYQLLKKNWDIHYLPQVLAHHRVDVKSRKNSSDYTWRLRRSLRSGWYLLFLFYPKRFILRRISYSIWMQFKLKVFKGDVKALWAIIMAFFDLLVSIPKIIKNANRLTKAEYETYQKLEETKIYWQPETK